MHKEENNLILRYLQGEATEEEIKTLFDWVDSAAKNREEFITYKKVWALSAISTDENINDFKKIQFKIKAIQNKKIRSISYRYAAVLVFGLFIASVLI